MCELTVDQILDLKAQGLSNREIARQYLGKESRESTIRFLLKQADACKIAAEMLQEEMETKFQGAKIWIYDTETSPTLSYHFGQFKVFVQPQAIVQEPYMLTWSGKWYGDSNPVVSRALPDYATFTYNQQNDIELITELRDYVDEADIIVAHNARFDSGWLNQRCAVHGLTPPSHYHEIDTLQILKKAFSLPSNSLDFSCRYFMLDNLKLVDHTLALWLRCMGHNCTPEEQLQGFAEMQHYNDLDVLTLENLYTTIRPFAKQHPNVGQYYNDGQRHCPKCGSTHLEKLDGKFVYTSVSAFEEFRCEDCGCTCRGRKNQNSKEKMGNILLPSGR